MTKPAKPRKKVAPPQEVVEQPITEQEQPIAAEAEEMPILEGPEQDGYYWVYDHGRDTVYLLLSRGCDWQDMDIQMEGAADKEVVAGPLPIPTREQIAGHEAHFEAFRRQEWAAIGFDPVWNYEVPPAPPPSPPSRRSKKTPEVEPYMPSTPMMDGFFWVQVEGHDGPECINAIESSLLSMETEMERWRHDEPDCPVTVLFGPLIAPDKRTVASRDHANAKTLTERLLEERHATRH